MNASHVMVNYNGELRTSANHKRGMKAWAGKVVKCK